MVAYQAMCRLSNFYPRSPCGERRREKGDLFREVAISIHALLAESDQAIFRAFVPVIHFYPRSPCGERRRKQRSGCFRERISIHALLAESDNSRM